MHFVEAYGEVMEPGPAPFDARRHRGPRALVSVLAVVVIVAGCGSAEPERPSSAIVTAASPTPLFEASSGPSDAASPSIPDERPLAGSGSIAVARQDGSLWLVGVDGSETGLADADEGTFGFPTWSPDGSRIAAVRTGTDAAIVVFDVDDVATGLPVKPTVIFRSRTVGPFYLSWTPDGKEVSFLANSAEGISLRIAPADGSAPVDGSGLGAVIRTGSPLYYDWIDEDLLIAHIGTGPEAFLGEIGRNDAAVAESIQRPGAFRAVDVSADGRYVGFVRAPEGGAEGAVVVAQRDGSGTRSMPVFGVAAVEFGPAGGQLASVGPIVARDEPIELPIGPLRLLDADSGDVRTLIEDEVVSFAWSPDGRTIAAIMVVPRPAGSSVSSASPDASAAPAGRSEIRLAFVDVESGDIRSQPVISPGPTYVNSLMTFFDQYALSHRLWAPDSSSILLPQIDADGTTHVDVFYPDGGSPVPLEGEIGFWSP